MIHGLNPVLPREKVGVVSSLPIVCCRTMGGVYVRHVSASTTHFDVGFFSFVQCVGVAQLVFRFLSEEIVLYFAVDLVCPCKEVSSGFFCVAILN